MPKNLVIVESPAKAKTIEKILGKDFIVKSSFGHIRDLDKGNQAVDVDNDFATKYIVSPEKRKVVKELKDWVRSDYSYLLDSGNTPMRAREITIDHCPMTYLDKDDQEIEYTDKNLNMLRRFIEDNFEDLIS